MIEQRERILIVDDDAGIRRTLELIFGKKGYETVGVASGREALEAVGGRPFNVVLVDINLPDMKGTDLLSPLKRIDPDLAVVIVTGHASAETAMQALNDGAAAYITKPLNMDEVLAEVCEILEKQRLVREKRQAERALRESERKFRTLFNSTGDAIFIHDFEGNILEVNDVGCERLGYSREEFLQLTLHNIDSPESIAKIPERMRELRREGHIFFETAQIRRDGTRIPVEIHSRLSEYNGRPAVLAIARDISERKEMEKRLHRQERLAAVGQLAGGIAHDFRNFLTTIMLYAGIPLRGEGVSSETRHALETVMSEAQQASELVQQILDFSGRAMVEMQPVDLVEFIGGTTDILRKTLSESVKITFDVEPSSFIVKADPTRIQQVLMNLALNARDAMPEGGSLNIALSEMMVAPGGPPPIADMSPGRWICLSVSDTGVGMTEDVKEHLFEPFFTTKEEGEGTGLGLAQVYGIVKQHRGVIDVESEPGEGSTFRVCLPAHGGTAFVEGEAGQETPRGQGETILVVEDEEKVRQAERQILTSLGYRVLVAENGRQALEVLDEMSIDVVLTDLVMPEMGGQELSRALVERDPSLRVIGLTGYALDERAGGTRRENFAELIHKPLEIHELAQAVRRALTAG